jgi:hypothetical protein
MSSCRQLHHAVKTETCISVSSQKIVDTTKTQIQDSPLAIHKPFRLSLPDQRCFTDAVIAPDIQDSMPMRQAWCVHSQHIQFRPRKFCIGSNSKAYRIHSKQQPKHNCWPHTLSRSLDLIRSPSSRTINCLLKTFI